MADVQLLSNKYLVVIHYGISCWIIKKWLSWQPVINDNKLEDKEIKWKYGHDMTTECITYSTM